MTTKHMEKTESIIQKAFGFILDLIFPPRCSVCGEVIQIGKLICNDCMEILNYRDYKLFCVLCRQEEYKCRCRAPVVCAAPFAYEGNIRSLIHRFKFDARKELAEPLADAMAESVVMLDCEHIDVVCDVPMSNEQLRIRGFNHSEKLSKAVASRLGIPYEPLLEKCVENREQHLLSAAERRKNVRGVYSINNQANIRGRTVLICDDVITTGATLSECAVMLRVAGAAKVLCVAASATKSPGESNKDVN